MNDNWNQDNYHLSRSFCRISLFLGRYRIRDRNVVVCLCCFSDLFDVSAVCEMRTWTAAMKRRKPSWELKTVSARKQERSCTRWPACAARLCQSSPSGPMGSDVLRKNMSFCCCCGLLHDVLAGWILLWRPKSKLQHGLPVKLVNLVFLLFYSIIILNVLLWFIASPLLYDDIFLLLLPLFIKDPTSLAGCQVRYSFNNCS